VTLTILPFFFGSTESIGEILGCLFLVQRGARGFVRVTAAAVQAIASIRFTQ
jgi:hypothetical protein